MRKLTALKNSALSDYDEQSRFRAVNRNTAHPPRSVAPKMLGIKPAADTLEPERAGKEASCADRRWGVSSTGPRRNEDPGESNSEVG